jgi:GDP-4-dehydro-6-deoxy-D-mannose reductase
MRLLITGASGFVGRHMASYAVMRGATVFGISRRSETLPGIPLLTVDLRDAAAVVRALETTAPDGIIHLAASTPANSPTMELHSWLTETPIATLNLFEAARRCSPQATIVVVSSSAVYGHVPVERLPITEDYPIQPVTMYGVSKAVQELLALRYMAEYGMRIVRVRPFNLVGPGEPHAMLTSTLAAQVAAIAQGAQPAVVRMRHRATSRDFTDVRDAVAAYWVLLERGVPGGVYNVCSGTATPIGEIVEQLLHLAGVDARIEETGSPAADDILVQAGSAERLRAATGWRPRFDLATSLRDVLATCVP